MIKFRHRNCDKAFTPATFAYLLPYGFELNLLTIEAKDSIVVPFGVALVHPKDNYNKAVGRENALKNYKKQEFKVHSINIRNNRTIYYLTATIRNKVVILEISFDPKQHKVRLEDVQLH